MNFVELYMELMADPTFAIGSAALALGVIVLLVLVRKFFAAAPAKEPGIDPVTGLPAVKNEPAKAAPAPTATASPAPAAAKPPEAPRSAPAPTATTKLAAPADLAKTVVLPPSERPPAPSSGAAPVDVGMYELLVRRVSALEGEVKRDPLFLDPLMKRVSQVEKRSEEIAALAARVDELAKTLGSLPAGGAPAAGAPAATGGISAEEFHAFKEKVYGLQKILEHLAENPLNPPA